MNKILIGVFLMAMLNIETALAESYLFPTDILPKGKFDIVLGIQKTTISRDMEGNLGGAIIHLKQDRDVLAEGLSLRYGFAPNWQFGVETSYRSKDELVYKTKPDSAILVSNQPYKNDGADNLDLFVRHRLDLPIDSRLSVVVNAGLDADTAANDYTGFNIGAMAGWRFNDDLKGYAGYSVFLSDQDTLSDRQTLSLGLHKKISSIFTLIPQYRYTYYDAAHVGDVTLTPSRNGQSLGIAAHIQVLPTTYLVPYVGVDRYSNYNDVIVRYSDNSSDNRTYSFSIYHLF
ncbi:MAG: hypothetical protein ACAH12_09400 [Methylophilaceae bacterium]